MPIYPNVGTPAFRFITRLIVAAGLFLPPLTHATFETPGQLDVSPSGAAWGYESMVGWAADPNPGVTDPNNNVYDPEDCPAGCQRTNVSGINRATGPGDTPTTWEQGGAGSRFLNGFPGGAAVSHLDDLFNNSVPKSLGDSGWFKAVTIPTALLVTVPALMPAPLTVELSVRH